MTKSESVRPLAGEVVRDTISLWPLLVAAVLSAFLVNSLRQDPLPWFRETEDLRLAARVSSGPFPEISALQVVSLGEAEEIFENGGATFVDAREEDFFSMGHIPKAVSLPREGFEEVFPHWTGQISKESALVIYCSEPDCLDSAIVAKALMRLGYKNVKVFAGGWQEWTGAGRPQEL